jgi:hypothetical protein
MGFGSSKQQSHNQSQQTSQSYNQAYPQISQDLGGQVGNVGTANNAILSLLGLNGSTAGGDAFNKFRDSSGYDFIKQQGLDGITAGSAAGGSLDSGATFKAKSKYASGLADQFLNSYLSQLTGVGNSGLGAAQVITSAGSTANSQGTSYGNSSGKSTNFSLG